MSESIRYESAERVRDYYRNQGAAKERERIIELLEEDKLGIVGCGCCAEADMQDVIALIKGETE